MLQAFIVFRGCLHSLAYGFFLHLQSQERPTESFSHLITLTLTLLPSSGHLGLYWAHLDNPSISRSADSKLNSIHKLHSPLPYNITHSQVPEIRMWIHLGAVIIPITGRYRTLIWPNIHISSSKPSLILQNQVRGPARWPMGYVHHSSPRVALAH